MSEITGHRFARRDGSDFSGMSPAEQETPKGPKGSYALGKSVSFWNEGRAKNVTFVVTQDCQLRCKYCYLVGKSTTRRMDFDIASRTVDYLLGNRELFNDKSVIWDFIGGEPLIEIELIDRICDYIKRRLYETDHPWFDAYRFSFSTNGLLYADKRVQRFLEKNKTHVSMGISIDGTRAKHDLQRVYPDGRGSYDDVVRNIPLWLEQFPGASTKATVGHDDLPLIEESVLHLWSLGIKEVNINCVFEDVWQPGDDEILEDQLRRLADDILDRRLYVDHACSFFQQHVGTFLDPARDTQNWCGAGKMLAVDGDGNFYPCVRFVGYSLQKRTARIVGNCFEGIDPNKLRPYLTLDRRTQSPQECMDCEVNGGCAWCQGANYDFADTDTIYQRATFICKMHKARVRANKYYWERFHRMKAEEDEAARQRGEAIA